MTTQERAAELCFKLALLVDAGTHMEVDTDAMKAIADALTATRRAAMLEVRQFCVGYEDCCVLGLVSHADKAVTNASISTTQFIKRHIDDRLAQEG